MYPASGSKDKETTILDPALESWPPLDRRCWTNMAITCHYAGWLQQFHPLLSLCWLERLCVPFGVRLFCGWKDTFARSLCSCVLKLLYWKKIENRSLKSDPKIEPQELLKWCLAWVSEAVRFSVHRQARSHIEPRSFQNQQTVLWNLNNWVN